MFKEVESHFANLPKVEIRRSKFKRPHTVKTTANFGDLVPFFVDETLPGDTYKISYSTLARLTTAIHPVMDNAYLDVFFFYVPMRILWEDYEKFEGANDDPWTQEVEYTIPQYKFDAKDESISSQSLLDYFGFSPVRMNDYSSEQGGTSLGEVLSINSLPIKAYVKIWNDYFRDENLESAETELKSSDPITSNDFSLFNPNGSCLKVAKYHDYFTSALPAPQKHGDVLLPLGQSAPVKLDSQFEIDKEFASVAAYGSAHGGAGFNNAIFVGSDNSVVIGDRADFDGGDARWSEYAANRQGQLGVAGNDDVIGSIYDPGKTLYADLSAATAATVNQLRLAIQTQRLFEKDARGGTRYVEILKSHFGITAPDGRLQRAEYLGGKRIPLNMDQIIQTSETSTTPLGSMAGWSLTRAIDRGITKSFVERGYIIGLFALRTDQTYSQGIEKLWSRKKRLDFYFPVMAHLGEMPILNKEIFAGTPKDDEAFGYQEAWADYRYKPSQVSGFFRPDVSGSLASWTYAQKYTTLPMLGSTWIKQGKSEVDNTLAVQSANAPQCLLDFYLDLECVRPMPTYSIPGLMDHF